MSVIISNLTKNYSGQLAVNDVSFEAKPGEILGFLGPNGAGKSTTMKIITCFIPQTSGDVSVCGLDTRTDSIEVRKQIGYLPEHNPLYKEMYVKEYLEFAAKANKVSKAKQRISEMIEMTGLGREQHKQIGALSKGFRQRVGLAQAMLHAVLRLVEHRLQQKHGKPTCTENGQQRKPTVCLVAYGKLGGLELGYGSDLDVVFLHDSGGENQQTDGIKSIENAQYFARLAQKLVHFMNTLTPAGILYEMDLRLRPNGQSGVLVTSFDSFANYQQTDAWTWEHQALVRARVVVAPEHLEQRFDEIRRQVLCLERKAPALREEVVNMRRRMRETLAQEKPAHMHLKQATGGIADIEFIVQYLVLANAAEYSELCEFTDNIRILEQCVDCGLLTPESAKILIECYLSLRSLQHRQALQLQSAIVKDNSTLQAIRLQVEQHWQQILLP